MAQAEQMGDETTSRDNLNLGPVDTEGGLSDDMEKFVEKCCEASENVKDSCCEGPVKTDDATEAPPPGGMELAVDPKDNCNGDRSESDSEHLLGIFPEEIWIPLLEQLDDGGKETLCNASRFFRDLLAHQRVVFLFPKVWNILSGEYQQNIYVKTFAKRPRWFSEIVKLRLVCRSWARGIDRFYQNRPFNFENEFERDDLYRWTGNWFKYFCVNGVLRDNLSNVQEFRRHFEHTHGPDDVTRSPFFGRRCGIEIRMNSDNNEALQEMYYLLENHGQHIWYTSLYLEMTNLPGRVCYETLLALLERMPNLKELKIISYAWLEQEERLKDIINLRPLPTLKNLRRLRIDRLMPPVFNELVRRNNHVSVLEVPGLEEDQYDEIDPVELPNLKEVFMDIYALGAIMAEMYDSALVPPPLVHKLELDADVDGTRVEWGWSELFDLLQCAFEDTLTQLIVRLPVYDDVPPAAANECVSFRLHLPKVKFLKLVMQNVSSLDFILPMKDSLESLEIELSCDIDRRTKWYRSVRREQVIQFLGFEGRLVESNIWSIFPKLKKIKEEWKGKVCSQVTRHESLTGT